MAGLLDLIFPQAPSQPGMVPMDPQSQALLNAATERASAPLGEMQNQINQGINEPLKQLPNEQQAKQEAARSGGEVPMNQALLGHYRNIAGREVDRISSQNGLNARMQKADQVNKYMNAALGQQAAITQNYATLTDAYNQEQMARAQLVDTLFQAGVTGFAAYKTSRRLNPRPQNTEFDASFGPQTPPTPSYSFPGHSDMMEPS